MRNLNLNLSNVKHYIQPNFKFLFKDIKQSMIICTGGRGSGKSTSIIQKCILSSFEDSNNILVIRGTYSSHKDTTFQDIKDWIFTLGLEDFFEFRKQPLEIRNKLKDSTMYFRGCDDVGKIKGIKNVKICFLDEANVGITEQDFRDIKFSMRGKSIKKLKYYLAYNPINPYLCPWKKYIDEPDKYNVYHHHSTYLTNPFNGQQYIDEFELLKETNPRQYRIDGLGEYGTFENAILDENKIVKITTQEFKNKRTRRLYEALGIDFGVSHDMTFSHVKYDEFNNDLYIMMSVGESGLTTMQFINQVMSNYNELRIVKNKFADSEDLGGRIELNNMGWDFKKTYKLDMELTFIQFFNNLNHCYIVGDNAKGFESNVASWCWKNGKPESVNEDYIDSVRYALETILKQKLNKGKYKSFNSNIRV